jgi:hypothetical protein
MPVIDLPREPAGQGWNSRALPVYAVMLFPQEPEHRKFWLAAAMTWACAEAQAGEDSAPPAPTVRASALEARTVKATTDISLAGFRPATSAQLQRGKRDVRDRLADLLDQPEGRTPVWRRF